MRPATARPVALVGALGLASIALAQQPADSPADDAPPPWITHQVPQADDDQPQSRPPTLAEMERELRRIRATYFGNRRNVEIRQIGIHKLRQFTDPIVFPSLLEIFRRERDDVRLAILDHLASLAIDEADATLAWAAVFDADRAFRRAAAERLRQRLDRIGEPSYRVQAVIAEGLRRWDERVVSAAAQLANTLHLVQAIPWLINAQIGGGGGTTAEDGSGALAYILIGRQQAFISDLQPVIGDSAVAFDPDLSVVTEGVVLRVIDAVVVTYRVEVHQALVDLSSRAWGRSTAPLGWDLPAWRRWYRDEFLPHLERQRQARPSGDDAPAQTPPGDDQPDGPG